MYIETLPLVVWTLLVTTTHVATQGQYGIGLGIKREVFFLNLEDGYFGCQVNESTQILQLYELSKLCDGVPDCYRRSDELRAELKCTDDCTKEDGTRCINGACLNGVCHCNDGFGGCNCQEPDINECKDRPCDVFAHCTNTVGSFQCSCFPGYEGDGFSCRDINECEDPAIASRCVKNAECCNLPAHFICKCNRGFEGDGEEECRDIDECRRPGACGINAVCQNYPGNYTCACQNGYTGNPFDGCVDVDECALGNACGPGAVCRNVEGGYECSCPPGHEGDPRIGCRDHDECARASCGRGALCENHPGSYRCVCPPGFQGDPDLQCTAIECGAHDHCAPGLACMGGRCADPCARGGPCTQGQHCAVVDHQPVCSKVCQCQTTSDCARYPNTQCNGCECVRGNEPPKNNCPHCRPGVPCDPFSGACMEIGCTRNEDCHLTEACINNACQHPCAIHDPCAPNAVCINTNHGSDCSCAEGFQGNGYVGCVPVMNLESVCQYNEDCPPELLCDRLNRVCMNPCAMDKCGENAECIPENHGIQCKCYAGYTGNPFLECYQVQGCRSDNECANSEACVNAKCSSPCRCGVNAVCDVLNHRATCKCLTGYTGNPLLGCEPPSNPCAPNPCGVNALCENDNGNPICYCPKGLDGNPFQNCFPSGNECEPNPCGPFSGCRLIDNKPACFCLPNYEGNPPRQPCRIPSNSCNPSPCGPNTQCTILSNGFAKCTCLEGYIESPNTIRGCVEARNPCDPNICGVGARCDPNRTPACYCPENTLGNPYKSCSPPPYLPPEKALCQPGPCGINAECYVSSNREMCFCKTGYTGDPYTSCQPPKSPCIPSPCGPQAICSPTYDSQPVCSCPPGSTGDPYSLSGCRSRECEVDDECAFDKACIGYTCRDPCPGACGLNARCEVESHRPLCSCEIGLIGNPLICCLPPEDQKSSKPCNKLQCGANAICQDLGDQAICSCIPDFFGDPYVECKPECLMNSDCPTNEACINRKCTDPCSFNNVCGINAECLCSDHTVSCLCRDGYFGDPLIQCVYRPILIPPDNTTIQPCSPNPCDLNAPCDTYGNQFAICDTCAGPQAANNPACRPECILSSDCAFDRACVRNKCVDPCPGSCGVNAECSIYYHDPICRCLDGYEGNPYEHCKISVTPLVQTCDNIQCGANAVCNELNGALSCQCLPEFYGNPYISCRPQCVANSDCPPNRACLNNKCENPCKDVCGLGASCDTVNHHAVCFCPSGHAGDPYIRCQPSPTTPPLLTTCDPSPCGPYSRCLVIPSGFAICSCLPGYRGMPPMCQPECVSNSDCLQTQTCVNQRCSDPCQGSCGVGAICIVVNHNPICSCGPGKSGDPFTACSVSHIDPVKDPCTPSPCGPNALCEIRSNHPVCSCRPNYSGTPPYCRPECVISQECPSNQACINEKCVDPCIGACGSNAKCDVINHTPLCSCLEGHKGDAFIGCTITPKENTTPCNPSPCGENTICTVVNNNARCSCIPPNIGNPYAGGCRPECSINSDCPNHLSCLSKHCRDPCQGLCGVNAACTVSNHAPACTCFDGYEGNPFSSCRPKSGPPLPLNPCEPSTCGPNSECRVVSDRAVCSCQAGYIGAPPACRPECAVNSDCPSNRACVNLKCKDPCIQSCGLDARCHVISHNPICTCPENLPEGDPFIRCHRRGPTATPSPDPCLPSPCGPHSSCRNDGGRAVCACEPTMLGAPPGCRPECLINQDCPLALACIASRCVDPCVGSCGFNARCFVQNHQPICSCDDGYSGDPFAGCNPREDVTEPPPNPCNPSPCGANALCKERNGVGACTCLPEYMGDPYTGCRPECVSNSDCDRNKACSNNKCRDPCPGTCGINAECRTINHAPTCSCITGYTGNPLVRCEIERDMPINPEPCLPSPCGPNSLCRAVNGHSVCTCESGYIGTPPSCRPECIVSSECPQDKACVNKKCIDPCPNTCGLNARCQVVTHNPICSCTPGYTGDPFSTCSLVERNQTRPVNPCVPSPCGPNSECRIIVEQAACSCLPNYIGRVPNCRPECTLDAECPSNTACVNERCKDPCQGACGVNALCVTVNHRPICSCQQGFSGDASKNCMQIIMPPTEMTPTSSPCMPSPCGPNGECRERNGAGACVCSDGYEGDPYSTQGCRRECESNNECPPNFACTRFKCIDPCPKTCGQLAQCTVENHVPVCTCPTGYTGDPFFQCKKVPYTPPRPLNPCEPTPCGPNSQCRQVNMQAVCSCLPNYIGSPPSCRPQCVVNSECDTSKACINQKCDDPCPNTCGLRAHCLVKNHNPICTCPAAMTGDPFTQCYPLPITTTERPPTCTPSPCGPNSRCQLLDSGPACTCLPGFIGSPPSCRPECTINSECPSSLACVRQKCDDPCPGSCGVDANCHVLNHVAVCVCNEGFTGDPFSRCTEIREAPTTSTPLDPCNPSPCGPNAQCDNGFCTCLPDYNGNPYESCRPECTGSQECPRDKACFRNKCIDPCPGVCGQSAKCDVINHIPTCSCISDYTGNPFIQCHPVQEFSKDPCHPSKCGPNSICRNVDNAAVCACLEGYQGSPPSCRPECIVSSECPSTKACVNQKCINPCINACGVSARCEVINHSPICSCNVGQTGDPFKSCYNIPLPTISHRLENVCNPSPCGPNSICLERNDKANCRCIDNYVGQPPNCRPECVINPDCPSNQACVRNKCIDPCPGSCGLQAECTVVSHTVSCTCVEKFTGNPFLQCVPIIEIDVPRSPCDPSPCGANAVCTQRDAAGSCSCVEGYFGNPYEGCRPECVLSSDCSSDKSCIRNKCADPCPGICGANAECNVINHVPSCACITGYSGNPFIQCLKYEPRPIARPCQPSPCGPNSLCRENGELASCECLPEYKGAPPDCRPECTVNSECPPDRACHKLKCADPCRGTCGIGSHCQVINHSPLCSCPAGTTGDPFARCFVYNEQKVDFENEQPCRLNPCGAYSECRPINGNPSCSCLPGYIGTPPNCHPECLVNTDCPSYQACIAEKCTNPCVGSCGFRAECTVRDHIPICSCPNGYNGDPFIQCSEVPVTPTPVPDSCINTCGSNAFCEYGSCSCVAGYFGDPYLGCRLECSTNGECAPNRACQRGKCLDPCPGACGTGATCTVNNHIPACTCSPGTSGDPFTLCSVVRVIPGPESPCSPSPCGPYSECTVSANGAAACSCRAGHVGSPPACRPECLVSSECKLQFACIDRRCRDPCEGACGRAARCQVIAHSPICTCNDHFTGDPFIYCYPMPVPEMNKTLDSCQPSPCGPNSICIKSGEIPACSCQPGFVGAPPNCRPECTISAECPATLACVRQKCTDPCIQACGLRAVCSVVDHRATCTCEPGLEGDPFQGCSIPTAQPPNPCNPSPCGAGAICRTRGTGASCECEPGLRGDPYTGCRPECLADSDCPPSQACMRSHCRDPCQNTCGLGAECETVNHIPLCSCPSGTRGNAFERCDVIISAPPCTPSPCGPGAICTVSGDNAVCSCPSGTSGDARTSGCRPECVVSSECPRDRACVRNKCIDPCIGACGLGAMCRVFDHAPVCSCPSSTKGDPFLECRIIPDTEPSVEDPCSPNPCAPHGTCRNGFCSYPECIVNDDCPGDRACINRKCTDPCINSCGLNAICTGIRHAAVCSCPPNYTGSPFVRCEHIVPKPVPPVPECTRDEECEDNAACINTHCSPVCGPANCGINARCLARQHRAHCTCLPGYEGDAYTGCYSVECHSNNDCSDDKSCEGGSCIAVCLRVQCGVEAHCVARGHRASCDCDAGARGDPWTGCRRAECSVDEDCADWLACRSGSCQNPCPGACSPNAHCTVARHTPKCECPRGLEGNPKIECREVPVQIPVECERDAECGPGLACLQNHCTDPCGLTSCGVHAVCRVADTLPFRTMICECPKPLTGDASVQCNPRGECREDSECGDEERCLSGRCQPACGAAACGSGAQCRAAAHRASCTCVPPLQGDPNVGCTPGAPGPECTVDSQCGVTEACVARRCVPACAGACGAGALCEPSDHRALCRCPPGTAGDPARACYSPECTSDDNCPFDKSCINQYCQNPCVLGSPCGREAVCEVVAHSATCRCPPGTQGDPRRACISAVCHYNEDCADNQICDRLNRVCQPACSDNACAPGALCAAKDHRPVCTCPPSQTGDPYLRGCSIMHNPTECTTDSDCPSPLACVNTRCTDLCLGNPCEIGLLCKTVDVLPLRAVACVCPDEGRAAPDSGCRGPPEAECSVDSDCANTEKCHRGSCVDACRSDPCGINAICDSIDHVSRCTCPPAYTGNPRIECNTEPRPFKQWECYNDDECHTERACINRLCVNPCADGCGIGALCRVINHKAQCSCPIGYTGNAAVRCLPPSGGSTLQVGCKANSECPLSQACINKACTNPCACGPNAECNVVRHHPVCYCSSGFSGNPYIGCVKVGCASDSECSDSDTCYNGACVNPCLVEAPCAISAECYGAAHRPNCRCPKGTIGNAYTRCQATECEIDMDCNDDSICVKGVCRNACAAANSPCAINAECFARNHAASCKCPAALPTGDPLTHCEKTNVVGEPECRIDSDCPSGQACLRDECRDPCNELKPCSGNARCTVSDSIPFRTMICRCPDGYLPDEGGACKPAQLPPLSCSSDQDCSDQESCINRMCRNPCNCGENAECFVRDHRPVCSCQEGYDGDPYRACRIVGCRSNSECESHEACINGNCISPCLLNSTCGPNADCYVERNHPLCRCLSGFEGDAYSGCNAIECRSNGDCPQNKQCRAHRCLDPCLSDNACGINAICLTRNHIAVCKCEQGYTGSPYVECRPQITSECYVDADCPSPLACLSSKCVNPCAELRPCTTPALCIVSPTLPVRTMLCTCPPGYVSSGKGICRPALPFAASSCEIDNDCTTNHACITAVCKNPCDCGPNTDCQIKDHKPVCACRPGFIGDARTGCYEILCRADSQCSDDETCINNRCIPACSVDSDVCGQNAECYGIEHRASCRCKVGTVGNPSISCIAISCRADSECPTEKSCINSKCIEPCTETTCNEPAECHVYLHEAHCVCPPGYDNTNNGCVKTKEPQCISDIDCPSGTACLNAKCVNPCLEIKPCGINGECKVIDTLPVRTMVCECIAGYKGNALVECTPNRPPIAKCITGQGVDTYGECVPCSEEGRVVDARGRCVCDVERGYIQRGDVCVHAGCRADSECDDRSRCINGACVNACEAEPCGLHATCDAVGHRSRCTCVHGYTGDPRIQCIATPHDNNYRTDFPLPDMQVSCLADGVHVSLKIKNFTGVLYVKGYSKDERCRRVVETPENQESPEEFTVHFGDCGLVHVNGLASFVLVMQKHPKLVTSNAKAFHIKCIYQTGEQNVTLAFNVSMLTTAGTIANTGPPPTCSMRIISRAGDQVNSAILGDNLVLQVDVQPSSIYGGFARSCVAKTSEASTNVENEYTVTDADGCATDTSIFEEWKRTEDGSALRATFNAFKFPSSDKIRFQCNIRVCFGKCQPVNCGGFDAFGKRKKRDVYTESPMLGNEGQLREEVTVESNQILTLERRDPSRVARQRDGSADGAGAGGPAEVCVSAAGLAVALALTALLALVAVAAAVACWLVAWRRARPPPAPLPHPPDFPNPLFQR